MQHDAPSPQRLRLPHEVSSMSSYASVATGGPRDGTVRSARPEEPARLYTTVPMHVYTATHAWPPMLATLSRAWSVRASHQLHVGAYADVRTDARGGPVALGTRQFKAPTCTGPCTLLQRTSTVPAAVSGQHRVDVARFRDLRLSRQGRTVGACARGGPARAAYPRCTCRRDVSMARCHTLPLSPHRQEHARV